MTRIRYISGPPRHPQLLPEVRNRIGSADDAQVELDAYVQADQYNFYQNALTYAQANTTEILGSYGGLTLSASEFELARNLKAESGSAILDAYGRQTAIASLDGVAADWGMDPALASIVESGSIGPGIGMPRTGTPHIGIIVSGTVVLVCLVGAAIIGAAAAAGILNTIRNNRAAADVGVSQTKELAAIAATLPSDAMRSRLYAEADRQIKGAYLDGLRQSLFSGFSGTVLGIAALGFGGLYIYNRIAKSK